MPRQFQPGMLVFVSWGSAEGEGAGDGVGYRRAGRGWVIPDPASAGRRGRGGRGYKEKEGDRVGGGIRRKRPFSINFFGEFQQLPGRSRPPKQSPCSPLEVHALPQRWRARWSQRRREKASSFTVSQDLTTSRRIFLPCPAYPRPPS